MQTKLSDKFKQYQHIAEAESILRACVHCGFCTATCPTYQLLGDELDGPRGRIYLIKNFLEGNAAGRSTQRHLDRCLGCHSCETTCPSGVNYTRLLDFGRDLIDKEVPRSILERMARGLIAAIIPYPQRSRRVLLLLRYMKPLLPESLRQKIPAPQQVARVQDEKSERNVLLFEGCIQSVVAGNTNSALRKILNKLGISVLSPAQAGCCSALSHHLGEHARAEQFMRGNIDAWWPHVESGVEAIVVSASGCAAQLKQYATLLQHDSAYAEKAKQVSLLVKDASEYLANELIQDDNEIPIESKLSLRKEPPAQPRVAFQNPCTLQHALAISGKVEQLLRAAGYQLPEISDAHICCGSAGSYQLLQPALSKELLKNKLFHLQAVKPAVIATANVGCQMHLQSQTAVPVMHWVELLAQRIEA